MKAVTLTKTSHLQYRAFELTIVDGKVVEKRPLDRGAGDLLEIQAGRCESAIWECKDQDESLLESIKDN